MLAFHPGAPAGFDPILTAASFFIALTMMGAGIVVLTDTANVAGRAAGGVVIGLGISSMHYTGMAAYDFPGTAQWNAATVACSVAVSIVFAAGGAVAAFSAVKAVRQFAPPLMVLAICSLNFVGMSAVTLVYDPAWAFSR